ncbi:WD40 repeat-like protein, partial [Aureobasidium melanogenum]
MDIDHSDSDTPDIDTDEEPEHIKHDEPEPMEGIEYSENFDSTPPTSLPARRPSILRNHISSRPKPSRTPDRFVFDRTLNVQPRERFMLSTPPQELTANDRWSRRQSHAHDAFGSKTQVTRRPNLTKSPVIARTPRTPSLFMSSRVNPLGLVTPESLREISQGAVWNVGGSSPAQPVDGVRSTSNGRGGRITSGTNAPMFRSDFSNHVHDDTDHLHIHGKRLSAAMEVDQANRVLDQGSGLLTPSRSPEVNAAAGFSPSVWRNNEWIKPGSPPLQRVQFLDAPALRDDYYCSLLAYSNTAKCLAVGLGAQVYTWSEVRGVESPESLGQPFAGHVTSLSFSSTEGESPRTFRRASVRHPGVKVPVEYLLVGDEAGHIYLYSVEWPNAEDVDIFAWPGSMIVLARLDLHSQQICGLAWSPDGQFFASGGNDNALFVFETRRIMQLENIPAQHRIMVRDDFAYYSPAGQEEARWILPGQESHHYTLNAAVKALAFCPWQPSLLAAGGGSNDRCIHFYHTISGAKLATIDCLSQVTSLVWSRTRREIAATFGFTQPDHPIRVAVFSWPACECIVRIPWYGEERALWAIGFPGGPNSSTPGESSGRPSAREGTPWYARRTRAEGCLVVASSDSSIKFHEVWSEEPTSYRSGPVTPMATSMGLMGSLGGSDILESLHGVEKEGASVIR